MSRLIAKNLDSLYGRSNIVALVEQIRSAPHKTARITAVEALAEKVSTSIDHLLADPVVGTRIAERLDELARTEPDAAVVKFVKKFRGVPKTRLGRNVGEEAHLEVADAVMRAIARVPAIGAKNRLALMLHNDVELFAHLHA